MEDIKLEDMWQAYGQQLADAKILNLQSWAVNARTFEYLQTHKAQSRLRTLARFKVWAVILGVLWVLFLGALVYGDHFRNGYFSASVLMILFFSILAIAIYIRQIILISQINLSDNLTDVQEKISVLKASTIHIVRVLWLQLPFYTTFFWSREWIQGDPKFWFTAFPITLLFTALAIWLYKNISYKNAERRWFRLLLGNTEWGAVARAINYLKQIEEFKNR